MTRTMPLPVVNCDNCGLCCMHMATPPYMIEEVAELMANHPEVYRDLIAVQETRTLQWESGGPDLIPCGWFDCVTRKCRHHEHKPEICREYEVGGESCILLRSKVDFLKQN